MHSEAELELKLRRRGFEAGDIVTVVESCRRLGYLDDGAYAAALVERRSSARGASAMAAELRARGVGREAIAVALEPVDSETEIEAARLQLARLASGRQDLSAAELLQRAGPRLQRRGFAPQVIREAWRRHLATGIEEGAGAADTGVD